MKLKVLALVNFLTIGHAFPQFLDEVFHNVDKFYVQGFQNTTGEDCTVKFAEQDTFPSLLLTFPSLLVTTCNGNTALGRHF